MLSHVRSAVLWLGLAGGMLPLAPQDTASAHLHERWRDRDDRERLERNLSELERLSPEARGRLLLRARALREHERELEREMTHELKERMQALGPEQWRAHLRERFIDHGRQVRQRLPPKVRERLE